MRNTITILLFTSAFAFAAVAQDQTTMPQAAQPPSQTQTQQSMPDQSMPAQTTTTTTTTTTSPSNTPATTTPDQTATPASTTPVPDQSTAPATPAPVPQQNVAPALPASDQPSMAEQNVPIDQSAISQELIQHERDSWDNAKAKNVSYFNALPDNVTAVTPDGLTEGKGDIISRVGKYGISDFNLSNFNVTFPSNDRAEVTYNASFRGKRPGGGHFDENRQVVSEWQLDAGGQWQNVRVSFR